MCLSKHGEYGYTAEERASAVSARSARRYGKRARLVLEWLVEWVEVGQDENDDGWERAHAPSEDSN